MKTITVFRSKADLERFMRGIPPRRYDDRKHLGQIYKKIRDKLNIGNIVYFGMCRYNYPIDQLRYFGIEITSESYYAILDIDLNSANVHDYYAWSDLVFFDEIRDAKEYEASIKIIMDTSIRDRCLADPDTVIQMMYSHQSIMKVCEVGQLDTTKYIKILEEIGNDNTKATMG